VVPGAAVSRANPAGKSTGASVIPGSQRRSGNSRSVLFVIGGANRPAASRRRSTLVPKDIRELLQHLRSRIVCSG